jgi:hypothetical protein
VWITHSERNIWNGHTVATAISSEKRKPVLEENGFLIDRAYLACPEFARCKIFVAVQRTFRWQLVRRGH